MKTGWLGILFRKIALGIDLKRFRKLIKKLEKEGFDYILSDRYFYDSAVNILYLLGSEAPKYHIWRLNLQNIPKPGLAIYLKINPEVIMQRERVPDQGLEYLMAKNKLFETAAENWNLKVIDGSQPREIVFERNPKSANLKKKTAGKEPTVFITFQNNSN